MWEGVQERGTTAGRSPSRADRLRRVHRDYQEHVDQDVAPVRVSVGTAGLERLSEEGKHSPLDTEIRTAIDQGNALMLFESGGLKNWKDSMVATVRVDPAHPLVSVVNMIAPSPDWFTGASGVTLAENGAWISRRTVTLYAYDSGGDDGTTYNARDKDTNPKKPTTRAANRHFVINGRVKPVATVTFVREAS